MSRLSLFAYALLASLALPSAPGAAELADTQRCASEPDDARRLACYDAIFGKAAGAGAASRAAIPAAAASADEDFGLPAKSAPRPAPESITRKVSTVTRNAENRLVIALDDGQVWTQVEAETRVYVNPGETVTIKPASLGSFKLVTPRGNATRVRRVK